MWLIFFFNSKIQQYYNKHLMQQFTSQLSHLVSYILRPSAVYIQWHIFYCTVNIGASLVDTLGVYSGGGSDGTSLGGAVDGAVV